MANDPTRIDGESDCEQIKQDLMRRGRGVAEAEAIAARSVKHSHARQGAAERAGHAHPTRAPQPERSYRKLYAEAKARGISGRSTMSKEELERRLG